MQDDSDQNEHHGSEKDKDDAGKSYNWRTHDDPSYRGWDFGGGQCQSFMALLPMLFALRGQGTDSWFSMSLRLQLLIWWLETWLEMMGAAQEVGRNALARLQSLDLSSGDAGSSPSGRDDESDW